MFLRLTKIEGTPEQIEPALAHYREQVVPRVRNLPGFVGAAVHVDRRTGTRLGLSMWETEEALRGSEQVSQAVRTDMVPATSGRVIEVDQFELLLQERNGPPKPGAFNRTNDIQGSPGQIDAALEFVRGQVVPTPKEQRGFRSVFMWANRQTGRVLVTSMWDSAADRQASDAALGELRQQGGQLAGAQQVKVEEYESVYDDISQIASRAG
jgi:heme-degrading monooxygenase HmoA